MPCWGPPPASTWRTYLVRTLISELQQRARWLRYIRSAITAEMTHDLFARVASVGIDFCLSFQLDILHRDDEIHWKSAMTSLVISAEQGGRRKQRSACSSTIETVAKNAGWWEWGTWDRHSYRAAIAGAFNISWGSHDENLQMRKMSQVPQSSDDYMDQLFICSRTRCKTSA
jgi:hypothetical protein